MDNIGLSRLTYVCVIFHARIESTGPSALFVSTNQSARASTRRPPALCDSRRPRPTRVDPPSAQAGCSPCPPPRPPASSAPARPTRAFPGRPLSPRWPAASPPLASPSARARPPSWARASSPPGTCGNRVGISGTRLRARSIETALASLAPRRRARSRRPPYPLHRGSKKPTRHPASGVPASRDSSFVVHCRVSSRPSSAVVRFFQNKAEKKHDRATDSL